VTNLSPEICYRFRDARRAAGIRQTKLAAEVGCKQSAISMFEKGDGTKLNDEVIRKLAEKFKIELPKAATGVEAGSVPMGVGVPRQSFRRGFCPNPDCPTNVAYEVDGRRLFRPNREAADPVGGTYCALCGEVLERVCPHCGAPLHDGAVCSFCGKPYVEVEGLS